MTADEKLNLASLAIAVLLVSNALLAYVIFMLVMLMRYQWPPRRPEGRVDQGAGDVIQAEPVDEDDGLEPWARDEDWWKKGSGQ